MDITLPRESVLDLSSRLDDLRKDLHDVSRVSRYRLVEGTKRVWSNGSTWARSHPGATLAITAGVAVGVGVLTALLFRKA